MAEYKRIALIGLDGSGKSANIDKMNKDEDYRNFKFIWVRWKPTLLKPAYWLMSKKVGNTQKPDDSICRIGGDAFAKDLAWQKQRNKEYNAKLSIKKKLFKNPVVRDCWMALALVDYFFQFYIKTLGALLTRKSIIFDRFYLDLFIDQRINFGYSPERINSEIKKHQCLFPKMDQIIYIRVSPETCYKRKDDIPSMNYLLQRYDIYEELSKNPGWITIDGEEPFESVYNSIKHKIFAEE